MALTSPSCRLGGVDFFLNRMALEGGGVNKTFSHFLKSTLAGRQSYSVPRIGSQTMRLKLVVYCRGNEVYRALLG